jgi:hypothetical protein
MPGILSDIFEIVERLNKEVFYGCSHDLAVA